MSFACHKCLTKYPHAHEALACTNDPHVPLGSLLEFLTEAAHLCPNCGDVDRTAYVDAHALELFLAPYVLRIDGEDAS